MPRGSGPGVKAVDFSRWPLDPRVVYGGKTYASLQKAIDATRAGDTLELPQGIYDQPIKLAGKKGLTVRGNGDGAYISVTEPVAAAVVVVGSSAIAFENVMFRRLAIATDPRSAREGGAVISVRDSNGVSFSHCVVDGEVGGPPDGDALVVHGGASILLSNTFVKWARVAVLLDHVGGQVGIDSSVIVENDSGVVLVSPGSRFTLNVRKSRISNPSKNLSIGEVPLTMSESVILLTKGEGDRTPEAFPAGNKVADTAAAVARLPDPVGVDWSWLPHRGLLGIDVAAMHVQQKPP